MAHAAPRRTRWLHAVELEPGRPPAPILTVVPAGSDEPAANEPRSLPVDVVMCCTSDDLVAIDSSYALQRGEHGGRVDRVVVEIDARPRSRR